MQGLLRVLNLKLDALSRGNVGGDAMAAVERAEINMGGNFTDFDTGNSNVLQF